MNRKTTFTAIVAAAGLAVPALAQDSVSNLPGAFVGDGLVPWQTTNQVKNFVVDMAPFTTSGGTTFGVAPIIKASKTSADFFGSIIFGQSISADEVVRQDFAAGEYLFWDFPGGGVNQFDNGDGVPNISGQLITPTADGDIRQFAAVFAEQADTDAGATFHGIMGAVVNYDAANPGRLYVSRVNTAVNGSAPNIGFGSLRTGTVDAFGHGYFRGDNFTGTSAPAIGIDSIYRTSLLGRNSMVVNVLSGAGGVDATETLIPNFATIINTPGNIPASVNGRPIYVGHDFNTNFQAETAPGVVTFNPSHLIGTDTRGVVTTHIADLLGDGGTTAGILAKSSGGPTDSVNLWSLDSNGALISGSQVLLTLPGAPVSDPIEGFTLSSNGEYDHYRSQTNRQGGNSTFSLGQDAAGRTMFAGTTYLTGGSQDPFNAIIVGRFDPANPAGTVQYSTAAWVDLDAAGPFGVSGKPVYDDMGNEIGELRPYIELDPVIPGPSLSGAHIDGAGNVWFIGLVNFPDPKTGDPILRTSLLRAVYEDDVNGSFGFRLEKVLAFGDRIDSPNTGLQYSVGGFEIADNNSVSSGTLWSSNGRQGTWGGVDASTFASNADPRSTGGIVVAASLLYDYDQDGDFTLNTMVDPNTQDELYPVLLYIANIEGEVVTPDCPADLDGSGSVGAGDLAILLAAWGGGGPADFDNSGIVGAGDLAILLAAWGPCPM